MMKNNSNTLGMYIHIPFCVQKCNYCNFLSFGTGIEIQRDYMRALLNEIRTFSGINEVTAVGDAEISSGDTVTARNEAAAAVRDAEISSGEMAAARDEATAVNGEKIAAIDENYLVIDSIFIGGGTPSVIEPELIQQLVYELKRSGQVTDDCEITMEANPGTLTSEKVKAYRECGINRISMGAQSFDNRMLKRLGRVHDEEEIYISVMLLRENGFDNINLDLMFGLPEQTFEIWEETVEKTLKLRPEHISFYGLSIEEDTPFYRELEEGRLRPVEDEEDRRMYHFILKRLREEGYHHYEISNAALPGRESRHNLKYWSMNEYIGFGLGAHSFYKGKRFSNHVDMKDYFEQYLLKSGCRPNGKTGTSSPVDFYHPWSHENSEKDNLEEFMFTGLRKVDGISKPGFEKFFGKKICEVYPDEMKRMKARGLLQENEDSIRLTELGLDLANIVMEEFIIEEK